MPLVAACVCLCVSEEGNWKLRGNVDDDDDDDDSLLDMFEKKIIQLRWRVLISIIQGAK